MGQKDQGLIRSGDFDETADKLVTRNRFYNESR
jgi:hypothetical protein